MLQTLWTDLRYAVRGLVNRPGFTAVTALTLALGIGGNVALFSVVRAVVMQPLPYSEPEELVVVWENDRLRGTTREGASAPDFIDFVEMSRSFESLVARARLDRTLGHGDRPEQIRTARVSAAFFATLGVEPMLGRDFVAREELVESRELEPEFVDHLLKWANGLQGKFDRLILPITKGESYHGDFKRLQSRAKVINEERNSIVHIGSFKKKSTARKAGSALPRLLFFFRLTGPLLHYLQPNA